MCRGRLERIHYDMNIHGILLSMLYWRFALTICLRYLIVTNHRPRPQPFYLVPGGPSDNSQLSTDDAEAGDVTGTEATGFCSTRNS